jgi:O-antigen/teichoic acid export membrane protein
LSSDSFFKNTIIYLVGGVVAAGGNILLAPMYLRILNANDYGAWSQFGLMLQFLQPIMGWGLLATMSRLLTDSDDEACARRMASALKLVTALNIGLFAIIVGIAQQGFVQPLITEQQLNLLLFALVVAGLAAYPSILMGVYVAAGKALQYRTLNLVGFIFQAAILGAFASLFSADVRMAILAMIAATGGYAAISVYKLTRAAKWNADVYDYKELFAFGAPVVLYTVAGQSTDFITKYALAASVTLTEFGAFSAGMIYASVIAMLASAINLAWVPLFYRRAQEWTASGVYQQVVDVIATVTAVCGMFLIIFSEELLAIYSGGKSSLDASIVGILVINAWVSSSVWMGLSNPMFHQKRIKLILNIMLLSIAICMPLAFIIIARLGAFGASLALLLNALTLCVIAAIALYKLKILKLNYSKLITILFYLLVISIPLMNYLHHELPGLQRLTEKALIFSIFAVITLLPVWKSALSVLQIIESDVSI